jgi:hypothetical protein
MIVNEALERLSSVSYVTAQNIQTALYGDVSVSRHIIITSCTKNKSTQYIPDDHSVLPSDYLTKPTSVEQLEAARSAILTLPDSGYDQNSTQHYAFDLYVRDPTTKLYRELRKTGLAVKVRQRLLSLENNIEWYFLSGGYGLLHALEIARPYQATFDRSIASKNNIPYTLKAWEPILPTFLDDIFCQSAPTSVSVFASATYVKMVESTTFYKSHRDIFRITKGRAYDPKVISALAETVNRLLKA